MKKVISYIIIPLLTLSSLLGVGYSFWYFAKDVVVTGKGIIEDVIIEGDADFANITFLKTDGTTPTDEEKIINLMFEPDRIYFLNNLNVNFAFASSADLSSTGSYYNKYINFSLSINLLGDGASTIASILYIGDFVNDSTTQSDEYTTRFIGNWNSPLYIDEDIDTSYTYSWNFNNLEISYARTVYSTYDAYKTVKNSIDTCTISYVFSVEVSDTPSY